MFLFLLQSWKCRGKM